MENQNQELLKQVFEQWQVHPGTSLFLKALRNHREKFLGAINANVFSTTCPDSFFRLQAACIKTTDAVLELSQNFEFLLKNQNPNKE